MPTPLSTSQVEDNIQKGVYTQDPVRFAREVIGFVPDRGKDPTQNSPEDVLRDYLNNRFTSVKSGKGPDKTATLSICALHFLITRPYSIILCTGMKKGALKSQIWREFQKWINHSPFLTKHVEWMAERVKVRAKGSEGRWFIEAVTASSKRDDLSAVGLQGYHGGLNTGGLLFIVDEASGVSQNNFVAIEGALSEENTFIIMAGNPTQLKGTFYDSHNSDNDMCVTYTLNGENSHIVKTSYCDRIAKKYGRDSDYYRVQVLGLFPKAEAEGLIPLFYVQASFERPVEQAVSGNTIVGGLDVALGGACRTVLYVRKGTNVFVKETCSKTVEHKIALWLIEKVEDYKIDVLTVDDVGAGHGVCSSFEEKRDLMNPSTCTYRCRLIRFKGGGTPRGAKKVREQYRNIRAQAFYHLRYLFTNQPMALSYVIHEDEPEDRLLREQLVSIKTKLAANEREVRIESKDEMKNRGFPSPDEADAMMLCFAYDLYSGIDYEILKPCARDLMPKKGENEQLAALSVHKLSPLPHSKSSAEEVDVVDHKTFTSPLDMGTANPDTRSGLSMGGYSRFGNIFRHSLN